MLIAWVNFLEAAVSAVNETPKPEVLHGEAPNTVLKSPEATFMLLQDSARKFQHNQKLLETRKDKLEAEGALEYLNLNLSRNSREATKLPTEKPRSCIASRALKLWRRMVQGPM